MGVVDRVGPNVTNLKPGQRVVASFQIACGECALCKQKLSSFCDKTSKQPSSSEFILTCPACKMRCTELATRASLAIRTLLAGSQAVRPNT